MIVELPSLEAIFKRLLNLPAHHADFKSSPSLSIRAFPGVIAYNMSKAAVDQLTRCTALELAPDNVRVNAVNPGVIITELHSRSGMNEDDYKKV